MVAFRLLSALLSLSLLNGCSFSLSRFLSFFSLFGKLLSDVRVKWICGRLRTILKTSVGWWVEMGADWSKLKRALNWEQNQWLIFYRTWRSRTDAWHGILQVLSQLVMQFNFWKKNQLNHFWLFKEFFEKFPRSSAWFQNLKLGFLKFRKSKTLVSKPLVNYFNF